MLSADQKKSGYICIPYKHDKFTVNVKEILNSSRNIKSIYFGTATFSDESKSYFPSSTNHYMLAKFENHQKLIKDVKKFTNSSPSFVFSVDDELFERDVNLEQKFISMYYITYNDLDTISTIANVIAKKEKIRQAGFAHMDLFCHDKPKFTFPYTKIIVLEVSDERSPQSIFKYCEKTRQDIARKGVLMNNFVNLSLLDKLK
tara:strand:- start:2236 stop:2841 length:606 start_codon:yes stop_codon:yes gene_type:complete